MLLSSLFLCQHLVALLALIQTKVTTGINFKYRLFVNKIKYFFQCCGAGAGGAEIILGPGAGAGAENKF